MVSISIETELDPPPRWLHEALSMGHRWRFNGQNITLWGNDHPHPAIREPRNSGATLNHPDLSFPGTPKRRMPKGRPRWWRNWWKGAWQTTPGFPFYDDWFGPWVGWLNCKLVLFSTTVWNLNSTPTTLQRLGCIPRWWGWESMKDSLCPLPAPGEKIYPSNHWATPPKVSWWSKPASPSSFYKVRLPSGWFFF